MRGHGGCAERMTFMSSSKARTYGSAAGLVAAGLVAGGVLAASMSANAASSPSSAAPSATQSAKPANPNPGDPSKPQRADETLLTGDTLAKVKAAVLAKYPGATFIRVETDSDGVYEAHITKADGTRTTVKLDKSFAITGEEQGGGHHHGGRPGDNDADGSGTAPSGTASSGGTTQSS